MIRLTLAFLAASIAATPALAGDARLVSVRYDADEVVRVAGRYGLQASIAFGEDERIENVAIGDSASWQVTPNKRANLLFVKPLAQRACTNMTVVTDRRTYFFDLVAGSGAAPFYVLRFTYPDEPKKEAPQQADGTGPTAEETAAAIPVAAEVFDPAALNFAWRLRGDKELFPARIYDDGNSTYLTWPAKASLPALQVKNEKGVEGPVNFAVRGDVIVVEGVPAVIVLRSGKDSATVEYKGAGRQPAPPAPLAAVPMAAAHPAAAISTKDN